MSNAADSSISAVTAAPYATRSMANPRRRRWLMGGAILVAAAALATWLHPIAKLRAMFGKNTDDAVVHVVKPGSLSITLKEDGELKAVNSAEIKCEVQAQGVKIEWVIDESSRVSKGDVLMRLASDEIKDRVETEDMELRKIIAGLEEAQEALNITLSENESKLNKAANDLKIAELEQRRYLEGDYEKSKLAASISIQQTEMELNRKRDELMKSEPLLPRGFVTLAKIQELQDDVKRLELAVQKAKLEMSILKEYEFTKNKMEKDTAVELARQELEREHQRAASRQRQAEAKVEDQKKLIDIRQPRFDRLKEQLASCEIKAPVDGIVQYGESGERRYWGGNRIAKGEQVYPGQTLLTIPDTSQMMVTTRIHEADRHKIAEDLRCVVNVPAVPGKTFTGRLSKIAKFADSERSWLNPNLKEHAAEVVLDETDAPLSPGDTAHVEIMIEEVSDVLAVPVQCVFSRGPEHFVFVRGALASKPVPVKLGRTTTSLVEITLGVSAGDKVIMAPDEGMLALLPTPKTVAAPPPAPPASPPGERGG